MPNRLKVGNAATLVAVAFSRRWSSLDVSDCPFAAPDCSPSRSRSNEGSSETGAELALVLRCSSSVVADRAYHEGVEADKLTCKSNFGKAAASVVSAASRGVDDDDEDAGRDVVEAGVGGDGAVVAGNPKLKEGVMVLLVLLSSATKFALADWLPPLVPSLCLLVVPLLATPLLGLFMAPPKVNVDLAEATGCELLMSMLMLLSSPVTRSSASSSSSSAVSVLPGLSLALKAMLRRDGLGGACLPKLKEGGVAGAWRVGAERLSEPDGVEDDDASLLAALIASRRRFASAVFSAAVLPIDGDGEGEGDGAGWANVMRGGSGVGVAYELSRVPLLLAADDDEPPGLVLSIVSSKPADVSPADESSGAALFLNLVLRRLSSFIFATASEVRLRRIDDCEL